jgi:hypothetical protein
VSREKYDLWKDAVSKTAKFVAKDFPAVSEEDLFQDMMMYVLSNPKLKDPNAPGMSVALYRRTMTYAWEYRKQALHVTSQYAYRTSDVRKIFETLFDKRDWELSYLPDDARSLSGDDRLVVNADVSRAYSLIPQTYQEALFIRYGLKQLPSNEAERKRLYRATEAITDVLNTYPALTDYEGLGTRKVITNATAQYRIQEQDGG